VSGKFEKRTHKKFREKDRQNKSFPLPFSKRKKKQKKRRRAMWTWITGIGSFIILLFASWCVGEGGEILGKKYDASIIGGLVIAWLNTAPEAIFFVTALQSGSPSFAVGAISGSTIVVCTVALGSCLWIGCGARASGDILLQASVKRQCTILAASVLVTASLPVFGFNVFCVAAGVIFYCCFLWYSLTADSSSSSSSAAKKDKADVDLEQGKQASPAPASAVGSIHDLAGDGDSDDGGDSDDETEEEETTMKGVLYLIVGGLLIISFSTPFINSVIEIAELMGTSPTLLAFFLAPLASEAPEILESIQLSRKGKLQNINIAYSNLVGGTVTKTTLLAAIFAFYGVWQGFEWISPTYTVSLWLLIICALAAALIGGLFHRQRRIHGAALFGLFIVCAIIQYFFNSESVPVVA
jgi:cation:H+ antiporter